MTMHTFTAVTLSTSICARLRERGLLDRAKAVAEHHHVTLAEMLGRTRAAGAVRARQHLWSSLYDLGNWSYPRLGALFDRDHSTIMAGIDAHLNRQPRAVLLQA